MLRNYQDLPATTSNDIDVLVSPGQFAAAERALVDAAGDCGYRLHNRIEFATTSFFFFHTESLRQIQIDLFTSLTWHSFDLLSVSEVLARRIVRNDLFAVPQPVDEAIINLCGRLIYHGYVREKYKAGIQAAFRAEPEQARARLGEIFGSALAEPVVARAVAGEWSEIEGRWKALRRALILRRLARHTAGTLATLARDAVRLTRRVFRSGGMTIVLLGADGSGKSTAGQKLVENLANTFPPGKGIEIHWKPIVFRKQHRKATGRPNLNPHGQKCRGRLASLLYLGGHWLEFFLGSFVEFRPVLFRGGLVLIDRYFYDFLVDQRRYRLQVPEWIIRCAFGVLRKPDLVFLLDAPAEVLQARKQEVTPEETARQVEVFRRVVGRLPNGRIVDATQPPDHVAAQLTSEVLHWLRKRTLAR